MGESYGNFVLIMIEALIPVFEKTIKKHPILSVTLFVVLALLFVYLTVLVTGLAEITLTLIKESLEIGAK